MLSRLALLLHTFGGLTPAGVWDLTVEEFHILAAEVDALRSRSGPSRARPRR